MALTRSTDPLVWIDCEMTGLEPATDTILSISCFITTHDLDLLDTQGYHAIISTPASALASMSPWCITTHARTGLTAAVQDPSVAIAASTAATELLAYIRRHVPESRRALLAGNSVHADRAFLVKAPWTNIVEHLHYRILDVSAIKEGVRRWCGDEVIGGAPVKKNVHSAREDVLESIEEARYYMQLFEKLGK